jgi:NAD(P)H-hydrate epimerase
MMPQEILTVAEMTAADRAAAAAGVPTLELMEAAGRAVADAIGARFAPRPTAILCGPGNNGGDGWVCARHLRARGWDVWVETLADPAALEGDAAVMARRWAGPVMPIAGGNRMAGLFVDALFGAGLSRPLEGEARRLAEVSAHMRDRVVAVDVPSGLSGDGARPLGDVAFQAALTVTFHRPKPAHLLYPGRALCGEVIVADIGIPERAMPAGVAAFRDTPDLWRAAYPVPAAEGHKYGRGHLVAVSGGLSTTGAARLSARGALRIGAGLVTVASPPDALLVNAAQLTAIMVRRFDGPDGLSELLSDRRRNAVVIGPGLGLEVARPLVAAALASGAATVVDADAITAFADDPPALFAAIRGPVVLTPHAGEFDRLFPGVADAAANKIEAARTAARTSGAVVLLKGPDTVVAAPDGRAAVNADAPPWLATAGSGDVLAGLVGGLLAQHMPPFEAASAAVWLHGRAAHAFGPGLVAEDLPEALPRVLAPLLAPG